MMRSGRAVLWFVLAIALTFGLAGTAGAKGSSQPREVPRGDVDRHFNFQQAPGLRPICE